MNGTPAPDRSRWWQHVVGYQIFVRSFADSDGDGVGDLRGVIDHLGYLELLGVQAIWISPCYPSPAVDAGFDVSDHRDVDPSLGTLDDFDDLVAGAHDRGMRILIDLVADKTSDRHPWFDAALVGGPGSPSRGRYFFRDGRGEDGSLPPNNWSSVFGGPAWYRVSDGQWYLHLFAPEEPDLNWADPEVPADLLATLRFWLDRGVDGVRIAVAHGLAKPEGLPDIPDHPSAATPGGSPGAAPRGVPGGVLGTEAGGEGPLDEESWLSQLAPPQEPARAGDAVPVALSADDPRFDDDGVHGVLRQIRRVVDQYPGRAALGEAWVTDPVRLANYVRPDELHGAFQFTLLDARFEAGVLQEVITAALGATAAVGSMPVWTLSNHDVVRPVTRYGGGRIGTDRARALLLVELALPGAAYLYAGEELGLPSVELADDALRDPTWRRSGGARRGRDSSRLPVPWEGRTAPYGFSSSSQPWLPAPVEYADLTVELQLEAPDSTLNLVRRAIEIRSEHPAFAGSAISWYGAPEGCLAFRRDGGGLVCALNTTGLPVTLPPGIVLLSSAPLIDGRLPGSAAAWLVP